MKKAVAADQRIRELPAGPPWYETITGNLPERFFGSRTLMGRFRPSCALTSVALTSISGTSFSDGRASLRNGLAFPVFASIAQGSYGEDGVDQRATKRLPSWEKSERKPWPSGIANLARGRSVRASRRRSSVRLPASIRRATASPVLATAIVSIVA